MMKKTYPSPNDASHCHLGLLHISHMWVVEPSHRVGSRQALQVVADWVTFGGGCWVTFSGGSWVTFSGVVLEVSVGGHCEGC